MTRNKSKAENCLSSLLHPKLGLGMEKGGISAQYTASINNYSIKAGRNKLGVDVEDNEYSYVQHSIMVLVDFYIGLDYKAAGAR
jgi:hypothetical protein